MVPKLLVPVVPFLPFVPLVASVPFVYTFVPSVPSVDFVRRRKRAYMARPLPTFRGTAVDYALLRRAGGYAGVAAVVTYVFGALAAATQYPGPFSPAVNWMSDLGSYDLNPSGALIYNACAFVAGFALVPFFAGLAAWYYEVKKDRYYYGGAVLSGLIAAAGMVMQAVFQEGTGSHASWAAVAFLGLGLVLVLANKALLSHPRFNRLIGYYGYLAVLVSIAFLALSLGMKDPPVIMEWLTAYMGFLWVLLFSYNALSEQGMTKRVRKHEKGI